MDPLRGYGSGLLGPFSCILIRVAIGLGEREALATLRASALSASACMTRSCSVLQDFSVEAIGTEAVGMMAFFRVPYYAQSAAYWGQAGADATACDVVELPNSAFSLGSRACSRLS